MIYPFSNEKPHPRRVLSRTCFGKAESLHSSPPRAPNLPPRKQTQNSVRSPHSFFPPPLTSNSPHPSPPLPELGFPKNLPTVPRPRVTNHAEFFQKLSIVGPATVALRFDICSIASVTHTHTPHGTTDFSTSSKTQISRFAENLFFLERRERRKKT